MNQFGKSVMILAAVALLFGSCEMEPDDPQTAREQMLGWWRYEERTVEGETPKSCQMQLTAEGEAGIKMTNFACSGLTVSAILTEDGSLTIPAQTVSGDTFEGSGTISRYRSMVLTFTYDNGRDKLRIVADCTKL